MIQKNEPKINGCSMILKILILFMLLKSGFFLLRAENLSFMFSAHLNCANVSIDSILIQNLSQPGDTVLYFPDTVLSLIINNIEKISNNNNRFFIFQNYPNPFNNKTTINVNIIEHDIYNINIYDINGQNLFHYNKELEPGLHSFEFSGITSVFYILTVNSSVYFDKIKMLSETLSQKNSNNLIYKGINNINDNMLTTKKADKNKTSAFTFTPGDELSITVWVTNQLNIVLSSNLTSTPQTSQSYFFDIAALPPPSPVGLYEISYESEINWNWSPVSNASGFRYNLTDNYHTSVDNGTKTSLILTGLDCETTYTLYVWAYNACGKSEALTMTAATGACTWTCGKDFIYHGRAYKTVKIADQCWFAENLNIGSRIHGSLDQNNNCFDIKKYCYSNSDIECEIYGGLYKWHQAMCGDSVEGARGICPPGWRIPTDEDFKELEKFLGMTQLSANSTGWRGTNQGSKLAGKSHLWIDGTLKFDLEFGSGEFDALPGGHMSPTGVFIGNQFSGKWWTSSPDGNFVWKRRLSYNNTTVYRNTESKNNAFYVRCVKPY